MRWTLGVAAVAVVVAGCGGHDGSRDSALTPAAGGITLNTSSWDPNAENAYWMQAEIRGVVRVDSNDCVYLGTPHRPDWAQNVYWPAGYTAAREADGTVTISDPDGVVVTATGHQISVGGGHPLDYPELACSAEGAQGSVMITDVLTPLDDRVID